MLISENNAKNGEVWEILAAHPGLTQQKAHSESKPPSLATLRKHLQCSVEQACLLVREGCYWGTELTQGKSFFFSFPPSKTKKIVTSTQFKPTIMPPVRVPTEKRGGALTEKEQQQQQATYSRQGLL